MAKYETTKELWDEVRAWGLNNGYTDLAVGNDTYASKGANHPVHTVNWYDLVKWCNARSEKEGLIAVYRNTDGTVIKTGAEVPTANWGANGYRLPTEAEWEKAARGGVSGKRYPWGTDTISHSQANYIVYSSDGTTNYFSYDVTPRPPANGYSFRHPTYGIGNWPFSSPVGSFAPNGYGLYVMAGNVSEWCWDRYGAYTYVDGATDPLGAHPSLGSSRLMRGGGWNVNANYCRTAYRGYATPTNTHPSTGFRVARSAVQ